IALFTSPYQHISLNCKTDFPVKQLSFHGDFYCIEYHKQEVACNGLLFNNIYKQPFVYLPDDELDFIFDKLCNEVTKAEAHSEPILRTYMQLMLAISSKLKKLDQPETSTYQLNPLEKFKDLLEQNFLTQRETGFYASEMALSPTAFSKNIKK